MERTESSRGAPDTLTSGSYAFDAQAGTVITAGGSPVTLRPQTAHVMHILTDHAGEIVSRDTLMSAVWPRTRVTEDSVTQCIREIRKALGDNGHRLLKTFPKRGYLLEAPTTPSPSATATVHGDRATGTPWLSIVVLVLFIVGAGVVVRQDASRNASNPRIVVPPFQSVSSSDTWSRIGIGLARELSAALARATWIDVYQPGMAVDETRDDTHYRLEGTIAGGQENVRLSVRFLDSQTGRILWSELWTGPQSGLFDMQTEILERVEATLVPAWTGLISRDRLAMIGDSTRDLGAFDLYLRAVELKHRFTDDALAQAQRYLEQALEIDPDYGRAWTALAVVHLLRMEFSPTRESFDAHLEQRIHATERALALSHDDPETLVQATFLHGRHGDHARAESALRHAVRIAWNDPDILAQAAWGGSRRVPVGEDAVRWARRAFTLNANPPPWYHAGLATAAFYAGDYDLAARSFERAPQTTEVLYRHAATEAVLGRPDEARALLAKARDNLPTGLTIADLEAADGNTYPPYVERLTALLANIPTGAE